MMDDEMSVNMRRKREYMVYRVSSHYDGMTGETRTYRRPCGETWAVSGKQAANNVKFRTEGRGYTFAEGPFGSLTEWHYEAVEV